MIYRDKYYPESKIKYKDITISVRGIHCGDKCIYRKRHQGIAGIRVCKLFNNIKLGSTDYFGSDILLNRCNKCLKIKGD